MSAEKLFLSHSTVDKPHVERLQRRLEAHGLSCWLDTRELRAGDRVQDTLRAAVEAAAGQVLFITRTTLRSEWVRIEAEWGRARGFRQVAVLWDLQRTDLAGTPLAAFGEDLVVEVDEGRYWGWGVEMLLWSYGKRADHPGPRPSTPPPAEVFELTVDFAAPALVDLETDGVTRTRVEAEVTLAWAGATATGHFRAPIGRLEADLLRWYLEDYWLWPAEEAKARADSIVAELPRWGEALWSALTALPGAAELVRAWLADSEDGRRLLTLRTADTGSGVAALLALPWELLKDKRDFLFQRDPRVAVRRQVVDPEAPAPKPLKDVDRLRVLAVVARPEKAGLIDPRATAVAILDAAEALGDRVEVDFLRPPTFPALVRVLREAKQQKRPFHLLHFDGHGVYDAVEGLGKLCFEHGDPKLREEGEAELVSGKRLREELGEVRLPLAFLEACQSAQAGAEDPGSAVATALLDAGAGGVIAMSHSVLVETARRFTGELYQGLCEGLAVGEAVARARVGLLTDPRRGVVSEHVLELRDWFVPVLFQRGADLPLLPGALPDRTVHHVHARRLESLPPAPEHGFYGRLTERLAIERAFEAHRAVVLVGVGGQGKTTLATESARWLYRTGRFPGGVAFVSLESTAEVDAVLMQLAAALIDNFDLRPAVAEGAESLAEADRKALREQILAQLRARPGLVVFDNVESVLPPPDDAPAAEKWTHRPELLAELTELMLAIASAGDCRLLVTSREQLPDARLREGRTTRVVEVGPLHPREAVALVGERCRAERVEVDNADPAALFELVEAVGRHARSLVLLPGVLRGRGVAAVTRDLHGLMVELERLHPGERERSLYASLRLSLDRLPARWRERIRGLAVLRVGAFDQAMGHVLGVTDVAALAEELVSRALATREGDYLRFHPALVPYLEAEARAAGVDLAPVRERAVGVYVELARYLYEEQFQDHRGPIVALAVRELPNSLRVLEAVEGDTAIEYATNLEGLLQGTDRHLALKAVASARARMAEGTGSEWSHSRQRAYDAEVDRLLEAGAVQAALKVATEAVRLGEAARDGAFPELAYGRAMARFTLGRVLKHSRRPDLAITQIDRAYAEFEACGRSPGAARMAAVCHSEAGDCLLCLGHADAAARRYLTSKTDSLTLGNVRQAAVASGQLATCHLLRGRLDEALAGYLEAARHFEEFGDRGSVAVSLHQVGMVYQEARRYDDAEVAYKKSLSIKRQLNNTAGMAITYRQLASCSAAAGRPEDAVGWVQRGIDISLSLADRPNEALGRAGLAAHFHALGRTTEAESQARAALAILEPLGIAAASSRVWALLHAIALARHDAPAAADARAHAMDWYRRYRAQGGEPETGTAAFLLAHTAAILAGHADPAELLALLPQLPPPVARTITALLANDPTTARALLPELHFTEAVEVELLLNAR